MSARNPFTGTWKLRPDRSRLAGPVPQRWIQRIEVVDDEMRVREEIVLADGRTIDVRIDARCDGHDYPVVGSPAADVMAYTRLDRSRLSGTAKKGGTITLTETATVSEDGGTLIHEFRIHARDRETDSIAVFERESNAALPVSIRPATASDREWAAALMIHSEPWVTLGRTLGSARASLTDPEYQVCIAHDGDEPLGFLILDPRGVAGAPYIKSVAVRDDRRGRGVGSCLMEHAEIVCRNAGARDVFLCVSSFNARARALYVSPVARDGFRWRGQASVCATCVSPSRYCTGTPGERGAVCLGSRREMASP